MSKKKRAAPKPMLVTDHAVLRYLERIVGVDVAAQVRAEILGQGRDRLIRGIGKGKLAMHSHGAVLEIVDGRVVTVKRIDGLASVGTASR